MDATDSARDPLVIRSLEFIGPMATPTGWRPESKWPEVAFAGRSNVGKSSLLNKLVRRKRFARVSNTPGRTREVNFFLVNDRFVLVDLPGYGYARISKERRAEWKPLIEGYLRSSKELRGIVQLLDVRHDPTDDDRQMLAFLASVGVPTMFALTKIDKLTANRRKARIAALLDLLEVSEDQVIPFSAVTGEGRDELAEAVAALVEQPAWRAGVAP
ncbi:MAG: ribosome biogenesis GTP-binding protein YihA/YsxC [Gemmatimonadaceae bacterium]